MRKSFTKLSGAYLLHVLGIPEASIDSISFDRSRDMIEVHLLSERLPVGEIVGVNHEHEDGSQCTIWKAK